MADQARNTLARHLSPISFAVGASVYQPLEKIADVYFPIDCVLSMITTMNDGDEIEVGTIGCEGFSAPEMLLGSDRSSELIVAQVPGRALVVPFDIFRDALAGDAALRDVCERYVRYLMALMAQCIACNRLHPLLERTARWLLTTADRVKGDSFTLTQEYMAVLLGVHRQAVSVAASTLQNAGYISYSRGTIAVADRAGLRSVACECYDATNEALARLCPTLA